MIKKIMFIEALLISTVIYIIICISPVIYGMYLLRDGVSQIIYQIIYIILCLQYLTLVAFGLMKIWDFFIDKVSDM